MINHVRTLLLNVNGSVNPGHDFLGEEVVSPEYKAVEMPAWLRSIRSILFGTSPDRLMLNYRLRQFAPILHVPETETFTLRLDSRITYWPLRGVDLFPHNFGQQIEIESGSGSLFLQNQLHADDSLGRLLQKWKITVLDGGSVEIERRTRPSGVQMANYTLSSGLSSAISLPNSSLQFRFRGSPGDSWNVQAAARPSRNVGDLLRLLERLFGEDTGAMRLFDVRGSSSLYGDFLKLWRSQFVPERLGGLLLALAYRTEALRHGA